MNTLNSSKIAYFEGDINYTNIYFFDGGLQISSKTLLRFEERFKHFIRINRKYLVNPEYIETFKQRSSTKAFLVLRDGKSIKVPRRKVGLFAGVFIA